MNAAQARALAQLASEKSRYLMEGSWTRFFPLVDKLRQIVTSGQIGSVQRVFSDHGRDLIDASTPATSRFVDPYQGAGGFLDLGHYSLLWCFLPLYNWKGGSEKLAPAVSGNMILDKRGFDIHSTAVLTWPDAIAVASTSLTSNTDRREDGAVGPATKIMGTQGTITIPAPCYRPTEFTVHQDNLKTTYTFPITGYGMGWEVDNVARDIAGGKLESSTMPLEETIQVMTVMDTLREMSGLKYPEESELIF
ncbi:hypothetical protein CLAIMM_01813 [Cladophialophora immunda]|nr:hypothetical protein CLAIMM_01813 [Cladophialophora immunda]